MSIWKIRSSNKEARKEISRQLGISPLVAHILAVRGIDNPVQAHRFLSPDLSFLNPPFVLKDMDKAVYLIRKAINSREKILIHGDYDADGVTASALLAEALSRLGAVVEVYLPHRIDDGYGLSISGIDTAVRENCRLVITVDCGITSFEEVKYAKQKGLGLIITDHHLPVGNKVPEADAVVNPKQESCAYPFKELAGVGVAFKLVHALTGVIHEDLLDLAAIGTIADIVPLMDENRILVKKGMERISSKPRPGIKALIQKASVRRIDVRSVAFMIAPKINAAGRIGSADKAFDLLFSSVEEKVVSLADALINANKDRQKIEEDILKEAMSFASQQKDDSAIVVYGDNWHPGVIGIVASRIVEQFSRPSFVISMGESGVGKGSARSVDGINLKSVLERCSLLLEGFGGHSGAAGFSITRSNLKEFKDQVNLLCADGDMFKEPVLWIDGRICFDMLSYPVVEAIEGLSPFGEGNPRPVFVAQDVSCAGEVRELAKNSIRFIAKDKTASLPVIGFGKSYMKDVIASGRPFDMAFSVSINEYNGSSSLQLELLDIKQR